MDLSDENPQTPLASETNKFWTTYNYLMDTNLIDSCHNKPNTPPKEPENITKPKFSLNSVPITSNQPFRSQRLSHESLRRLRRWLNEMDKRFALAPTLSDAMKLNKKELQNYLTIHADLYKEIVSRERPVAFCIRSITHHNLFESTANITDQQSSSKSDNSEKENNLSKALQRRYHLLYLKAIEVQCMLEGLLEKRKKIKSMAMSMNSSDEEPYYKIAKYKHKSNGKEMSMDYQGAATSNSLMTESSSGNDTGHHEGSDSLIDFDIVSHSSISPPLFSDTSCGFENTAECSSSNQSVKSDTLTNFQHSNRKSMNCGTFYYEYKDDKDEQTDMTTSMVTGTTKSIKSRDDVSERGSMKITNESSNTLMINTWDFLKTPEKNTEQLPFEFVTPRKDMKITSGVKKLRSLTTKNENGNEQGLNILMNSSDTDDNADCKKKLRKRRKKMSKNSPGSELKIARIQETNSTQRTDTTHKSHFESPNISAILNTSDISEPAWDDYFKNYDTDLFSDSDFEAVKNSLEFGDDYREFLGSLSESLSSSASDCSASLPSYRNKFIKQQSVRSNIKRIIDECEPMQKLTDDDLKYKEKITETTRKFLDPEDYVEIVEICRKNIECLERVLKDPESKIHGINLLDANKECHCARITKFIAFCLDFILNVTNYVTSTTLYKFLSATVKNFYAMINFVRRKTESFIDNICRRLARF